MHINGNQETFMHFLKEELNAAQYEAVVQPRGAFLVIAGAGSGKTRIITARMAYLMLCERVSSTGLVALTFTNKAAQEMKERLTTFLEPQQPAPFVGTFHSYCLLLLKKHSALLPYQHFSVFDGDDQKELIKKIISRHGLEKYFTPTQAVYQISLLKNAGEEQAFDGQNYQLQQRLRDMYVAYEEEKAQAHCFDFDDLLLITRNLFKKNALFKEEFQRKVRHILVDEYQDTNRIQHDLLKEMALDVDGKFALDSVCVVGDEDQSIYSWRGAMVSNMLDVKRDFAPVSVIKVEQNYRSPQMILDAANEVIEKNLLRNPKKLWSQKAGTNRIGVVSSMSAETEAEIIITLIASLPPSIEKTNVAVLYRTHFQSRTIEEALIRHAIPYVLIGGIRFYERKEIKDLLAYLRLIHNPFDKISLLRIINYPLRGLGEKFEEMLLDVWKDQPFLDFKQLLGQVCQGLAKAKREAVESFLAIFDGLTADQSPLKLLNYILEATDYLAYLRRTLDAREAETKGENVRELIRSVELFERTAEQDQEFAGSFHEASTPLLTQFLHNIALMQEKLQEKNTTEGVQLMTLHAAKGLEFDVVIIAGLEEGLLPSGQSLTSRDALEEERRLFYVGMTRAREYLLLTYAVYRQRYGSYTDNAVSRFLSEIQPKRVKTLNIQLFNRIEVERWFKEWLGLKVSAPSVLTFGRPAPRSTHTTSSVKMPHATFHESSMVASPWRKNQTVYHKKFGVGIVTQVEKIDKDNYYITARFREGEKKIVSSFLSVTP